MRIEPLQAATDSAAVTRFFRLAADYVLLESGQPPSAAQTEAFFAEAPPGIDPTTSQHFGLYLTDGHLAAIATVAYGFPNVEDAYIGLLLIDPDHRGKRLGQLMLDHIFAAAKTRKAARILIAVLEENTKGHRFWSKMGFVEELRSPPNRMGLKTHIQIRMTRPL